MCTDLIVDSKNKTHISAVIRLKPLIFSTSCVICFYKIDNGNGEHVKQKIPHEDVVLRLLLIKIED